MLIKENMKQSITDSKCAADIFRSILDMRGEEDQHKECFYAMGLNSHNTVLFVDLVTIGTVNQCNPVIREVVRQALVKNAVSLIVCHNHPSGDTKPSDEDKVFTNKLRDACEVLSIKLLDHVIIGEGFYSFSDVGQI